MTNPWIVRYQHSWVSPHSQEWPGAHWTPGLPNSLHAWLGQRRALCPKWWPAAQMKQDKHALGTAPLHACCHEHTPVDRQKSLRHAKIPCNNVNLCFEYERTREWHCVCFIASELIFMLVVVVMVGYTCTAWVQPPCIVWKQSCFLICSPRLCAHGWWSNGSFSLQQKTEWDEFSYWE